MDPRSEFRAPPPSPSAGSRSSSEDDKFGGFLTRSIRVPELVLPDRVLGRGSAPWDPPELDFRTLEVEELRAAAASVRCFQIVNHGIAKEVVDILAGKVFRLPPEKRREVTGSRERSWGFEEEEEEMPWWSGGNDEQLAGIWPCGYKDFRGKLERLRREQIQNDSVATQCTRCRNVSDTIRVNRAWLGSFRPQECLHQNLRSTERYFAAARNVTNADKELGLSLFSRSTYLWRSFEIPHIF